MATRKQVRETFQTNLQLAVPASGNAGHVPNEDVKQERPESDEDLPALIYDDNYRKVPINQASTGPIAVNRDVNDDVTGEEHGTLHEARFGVLLWFLDEAEKEACYEAVRTYFEKYEHGPWPASDIQADVAWVRVTDSSSEDDASIDPVRRGDRLVISLVFLRTQERTGTAIQQTNTELDADNDGTTDLTWSSS